MSADKIARDAGTFVAIGDAALRASRAIDALVIGQGIAASVEVARLEDRLAALSPVRVLRRFQILRAIRINKAMARKCRARANDVPIARRREPAGAQS